MKDKRVRLLRCLETVEMPKREAWLKARTAYIGELAAEGRTTIRSPPRWISMISSKCDSS